MDEKKLNQANKVLENINKAKAILEATKQENVQSIVFSYDDGSEKGVYSVVCTDLEEIEAIRTRLIASHEKRLKQLEDKFKEL